jgi:hypothetical protein
VASSDNIRVRYEDGLILGAAQLSGDQTYFRAALERRSLARDMFGIAWGLGLRVEGGASGSIIWLDPGVAYDGEGKPIIVRERAELSSLLSPLRKASPDQLEWAVYLVFQETEQQGKQSFVYCGQAMAPITTEGYRIEIEPIDTPLADDQRPGARLAPQSQLAGSSTPARSRVRLGQVTFASAIGNPTPVITRRKGRIEIPESADTTSPDADPTLAPARAEYVGVVAAQIAHPRQWTGSRNAPALSAAIVLEPDSGIHLEQNTVLHANARVEGVLYVNGQTVGASSDSGYCVVLDVSSDAKAKDLVGFAVSWDKDTATPGVKKAPTQEVSDHVLGIAVAPDANVSVSGQTIERVRVAVAGPALVKVSSATPISIGNWLVLKDQGELMLSGTPHEAGSLVAKVIGAPAGDRVPVIVCLG